MGNGRFLYNNFITDESMLSVSSLRSGMVTSAKKEGTGSATITVSGSYSGAADKEYIVEIDSIAGGAEVGQATFKWSDGGGSWDATGVTTPAVATELNDDAYILFSSGSGADFVAGDKWYFKGINLFNPGKMIDMNRDHRYRSGALGAPNTITITLTAEAEVDALVIFDHNLTSAATIALWGDDAATFDSDGGAAQVIESITWASGKILHYLTTVDRTKRYWQLRITDAANTDLYVEIGELYLGDYLELTANYMNGYSEEISFLKDTGTTPYGVNKNRFYNRQSRFQFDYNMMVEADVTSLKTLVDAVASRSSGEIKPFWFNSDSADTADCWMVELESLPIKHHIRSYYDMPLTMLEAVTSV